MSSTLDLIGRSMDITLKIKSARKLCADARFRDQIKQAAAGVCNHNGGSSSEKLK